MAQKYYVNSLASTTRSTYAAGQHRFTTFCMAINAEPIPMRERVLSLFVTHLATGNISHTTIKVCLSAVCHMHVTSGKLQYFNQKLTPRLQQNLKGIRKDQAATRPKKVRLPITLPILQDIYQTLAIRKATDLHQHHDMGSMLSCLLRLPEGQQIHCPNTGSI